jgi:hypothetical protein
LLLECMHQWMILAARGGLLSCARWRSNSLSPRRLVPHGTVTRSEGRKMGSCRPFQRCTRVNACKDAMKHCFMLCSDHAALLPTCAANLSCCLHLNSQGGSHSCQEGQRQGCSQGARLRVECRVSCSSQGCWCLQQQEEARRLGIQPRPCTHR